MKQIEVGLIQVHENSANSFSNTTASTTATPSNTNLPHKEPFLRVDVVSNQSPAETAGLHVGDLVCCITGKQ
jgi:predicted metalloprotease with PDZ domain